MAERKRWFSAPDPGAQGATRTEREFLPAALEVLETPPSPTGRAMALAIGAIFLIAIAWSIIGQVDIIAVAPGRLSPAGKVKVVQPLDPGIVRAIAVHDGDHVTAGQLLVELDATETSADVDRLAHDLTLAQLDVARLTALKRSAETGGAPAPLVFPPGVSADDEAQARAALKAQVDAQAGKIGAFDEQIAQKRAEEAEARSELAKLNASIPLLAQKQRLHEELRAEGYGTSFAYIEAQQALSEAQHSVTSEIARAQQAAAGARELASQRGEAISEYAAGILGDLAKALEKENELTQELVKAREKSSDTQLRSPIDGVVEQLAVHTIGGVVTPAERLMMVVPDRDGLTVEAQLANRDVGFVHPGQDVQIKVEAFNFTRYGLIHGKVIDVSRDTVSTPETGGAGGGGQPQSEAAAQAAAASASSYTARISLERSTMLVDGKLQPLIPGMTVTAEIKTGKRSIIDYLLSPLNRKSSEAMRER